MTVSIVAMILTALAVTPAAVPEGQDPVIVAAAVERGAPAHLVDAFAQIEERHDVPREFRGLLLAKAWRESRYNPDAEGDWFARDGVTGKRVKCKRGDPGCRPMAIGCLQSWPWAGTDAERRDCVASAEVYLAQVQRSRQITRRRCNLKSERVIWLVAMMRVNRSPTYRSGPFKGEQRCAGSLPKSIRALERWRLPSPRRVQRRAPDKRSHAKPINTASRSSSDGPIVVR